MNKILRNLCLFVVVLSLTLVLAGAGIQAETQEPEQGGTLSIARVDDATELDPHTTTAHPSRRIFELVYNNLVGLDNDMEPVPELAEDWEMAADATEYTFYLREDVYFHNGEHMTAEDVEFSLERILDEDTGAAARSLIDDIENIRTPGDYEVVLELEQPNATILLHLADANTAIVNKNVVEGIRVDSVENTIGTGAFQLEEWYPDEEMLLSAHEEYFEEGKPYLDELVFEVIPEEFSIVADLRTGRTDFALLNLPTAAQAVRQDADEVELLSEPSLRWTPIFINTDREPLGDKNVRQAMSFAINREEIIQSAFLGEAEPTGPIPPSLDYWAMDLEESPYYTQDLGRAEELLAEAGYEDGFSVQLSFMSGYEEVLSQVQVIQNQLDQIGINLELEALERGIYIDRWVEADFDLALSTNAGAPDPDYYLYRYFHSDGSLAFIHGNWSDERLDELLSEARREVDSEHRKDLYLEAQEILVENAPFIWIESPLEYFAHQDYVKGFTPLPTGGIDYLKDVWIDN